jgi:outer membrane protein OmpA-like peptidoglycan-associated protein
MKAAGLIAAGCSLNSAAQAAFPDEADYVFLDLYAVQHEERIPERDLGVGGRVGLGFPLSRGGLGPTAVELGYFTNPINNKDDRIGAQSGLMLDLVQNFKLGGIQPYVFAGLGGVQESEGPVDDVFFAVEAGLGLLFDVFEKSRIRVGLSGQSVYNDQIRPDQDELVDLRFNLGIAVPIWGMGAPARVAARVVDSDGDGLLDDKDACPSIPASTADGCPPPPPTPPVVQTDSDGDGVYDAEDKCAGTLEGLKVDASGCAVQTEAQSVVLKGVTFLPSSATLTAEAKTVLDSAVAALSGQADLKVELGGHTDSQGKDAANMALSQKRAESVRKYLIDKGIDGGRLTAKGYGETQPIADNNTLEGRKENRRVELKIVK